MAKKKTGRAAKAAQFRPRLTKPRGRADDITAAAQNHFASAGLGFSMQDEARNTAQKPTAWASGMRLRDRPVTFISAGIIQPPKESEDDEKDAEKAVLPESATAHPDQEADSLLEQAAQGQVDGIAADCEEEPQPGAVSHVERGDEQTQEQNGQTGPSVLAEDGIFFDTVGEKAMIDKPAPPKILDPVSEDEKSDSSAEIILFKGRLPVKRTALPIKYQHPAPSPAAAAKKSSSHSLMSLQSISTEIEAVEKDLQDTTKATKADGAVPKSTRVVEKKVTIVDELNLSFSPPRRASDHYKYLRQQKKDEEDAIYADYLANLAKQDAEDQEEGSGEDKGDYQPHFSLGGLGNSDSDVQLDGEDDDDQSDLDDEEDDDSEDDADPLKLNEEEEDDDDDDVGLKPQMSDEQLARLLAKQEELGMGGDDLVLFDGSTPRRKKKKTEQRSSGWTGARSDRGTAASSSYKQAASRQRSTATAVADAFDDLDLMDWERPSLQKKPKAKHGEAPAFGLSDSEMEATLRASWQRDRLRKKEKRREREGLRAQGLLGKGAENPDAPRVKYQKGMTLDNIKEELRGFLRSEDTVLQLPPMDASARKIVHELASKFKVKSKSAGSGDQRHPALYRTKNTIAYGEIYFEQAVARLGRRYFPRLDAKGRGGGMRAGDAGRGVGSSGAKAVTVREGEVVGGSAPELAETNRGRTMLQKMGWSTGMALGAMDNKGILQPVSQVVKRSRAGLG